MYVQGPIPAYSQAGYGDGRGRRHDAVEARRRDARRGRGPRPELEGGHLGDDVACGAGCGGRPGRLGGPAPPPGRRSRWPEAGNCGCGCFGALEVSLDGRPVALQRRSALALLAYLAVTGRTHRREALATLLADDGPATRRAACSPTRCTSCGGPSATTCWSRRRRSASTRPAARCWTSRPSAPHWRPRSARATSPGAGGGAPVPGRVPGRIRAARRAAVRGLAAAAAGEAAPAPGAGAAGGGRPPRAAGPPEAGIAAGAAAAGAGAVAGGGAPPADGAAGPGRAAQRRAQAIRVCRQVLAEELETAPEAATVELAARLRAGPRPVPHNLPPEPVPFVGREAELTRWPSGWPTGEPRAQSGRAGGQRKTRLALEAARRFADPARRARRAPVPGRRLPGAPGRRRPDAPEDEAARGIARAVAGELRLGLDGAGDPVPPLVEALRDRALLLVLDASSAWWTRRPSSGPSCAGRRG